MTCYKGLILRIFFAALAISIYVPLFGNVPANAQPDETEPYVIKIVSSLPRTGSANAQTTSMVNGIRMAIDEANASPLRLGSDQSGVKGGKATIVYEDWDDASPERGAWDPGMEGQNADKAIRDADVMAYIGPYNSGAAKISMPKLNQAGLLMVSPGNTWPGLTKPGVGESNEPHVYRPSGNISYFRVVPADDIQGYVAAKWAAELDAKRVFILHDRELYGKGIAEMFRRSSDKFGLEIIGFEGIDPKASNYKALVVKIRQKRPDLIYFGGTTQSNAGQIAKDIRAGGLKVTKLMVPDGCFENAFIESAGKENLEATTFITFGGVPADQLSGKGRAFYEKYKSVYNTEPEAYAAYGYEAAKAALLAIEKAGVKDRAEIVRQAREIKNFDGVLGTWSFDQNGDTTLKTMSGNTVKDGKFAFVKVLGDQ